MPAHRTATENSSPAERLQHLLSRLPETVDGIRRIAMADTSGLPVASSFPTPANILTVTAMAAMAVQSSKVGYRSLGLACPNEVVMVGKDSAVFVSTFSSNQLPVSVVFEAFADLGLVCIEVEWLGREVAEILGI